MLSVISGIRPLSNSSEHEKYPSLRRVTSAVNAAARILALLAVMTLTAAAGTAAAPLSTKYFSLEVPPDWKIVDGPVVKNDMVHVLLGQKNHKCSIVINVSPAAPGEAEKKAGEAARMLNGARPTMRNGQLEFGFKKMGDNGFCIIREDKKAKLLILVVMSGNLPQANFIYSMRSDYPALIPTKPEKLW